jgi:hypothetical protein
MERIDQPAVIELPSDRTLACRVVAVQNGITLRPSSDASRPDPSWTSVVRDSRGIIYTAATAATGKGTFLAWSTKGSFLASVGRLGEGPGELLGKGLPTLFIAAADSVYVREGPRWSVFDPDFRFARLILTPAALGKAYATHITEDGGFLSTGPVPNGDRGYWFHVADAQGRLIRSFGRLADQQGSGAPQPILERASTYRARRFWVAPPPGAPGGYVLEEWHLNGRLLGRLSRADVWNGSSEAEGARRLPLFWIHADDKHRLWVMILIKDRRWRRLAPGEREDDFATELYDLRYEVIDPDAGTLLAAGVIDEMPAEDERDWPPIGQFIAGTSISYRPVVDSVGFQTIEFAFLRLVPNR